MIVPQQKHTSNKKDASFDKDKFQYDTGIDCYICPEGHVLSYRTVDTVKKSKTYQITDSSLCVNCQNFTVCTNE